MSKPPDPGLKSPKVKKEVVERPSTVKVLHKVYNIKYDKALCDSHYLKHDNKVSAFITFDTMYIVIDHTLPAINQKECLLHEIQHACFELVQLAIDNPEEEQLVTIGTPILYSTLTDPSNKAVFDFLFGE